MNVPGAMDTTSGHSSQSRHRSPASRAGSLCAKAGVAAVTIAANARLRKIVRLTFRSPPDTCLYIFLPPEDRTCIAEDPDRPAEDIPEDGRGRLAILSIRGKTALVRPRGPDRVSRRNDKSMRESWTVIQNPKRPEVVRERKSRPRVSVTDLDRAHARYEVGDEVSFSAANGSRTTGTIEKLNPKRAVVSRHGETWDVPYHLLRHRKEMNREGNEHRLFEAANQARSLMDEHGLGDWTFRFSAARSRLGECREREKLIRIGIRHAVTAEPREVRDTILHEIAHALAGAKAGHGPAWKTVATRIGATPKARAEEGDEARAARQDAKARSRAGMEVSFRVRGGQVRTGVIVRMNPKRASVRCSDAVYLVPYARLETPSPSTSGGGGRTPA